MEMEMGMGMGMGVGDRDTWKRILMKILLDDVVSLSLRAIYSRILHSIASEWSRCAYSLAMFLEYEMVMVTVMVMVIEMVVP